MQPPPAPAGGDPLFNQSVAKALAVLRAYDGTRRALGLREIAEAAGLSASSTQRCVHTLVQLGYLRRDARERGWLPTLRTLSIGYGYLAGHPIIERATRHLVDLNQACGESVSLSEPDDPDMVYVARFHSHKPFMIHMPVGRRLPMYCTASGRAYLSALPRAQVRAILARSPLSRLTPHTIVDVARIEAIVDAARDLGFAWANEECFRGDLTIAAPILSEDGHPVAAVNVSGPTSRWTPEQLRERLAPVLLETARAASRSARAAA